MWKKKDEIDAICGIYMIKCNRTKSSNGIYIGQSVNIKYRLRKHKESLRRNGHDNKHLQRIWNKYKEESFEFSIVEICEKESLTEREIHWIDFYDCIKNGINQKGGSESLGFKHTEETKKILSEINKKKIHMCDENFEIIKTFNGFNSVFEEYGFRKDIVRGWIKNKTKAHGYYWKND